MYDTDGSALEASKFVGFVAEDSSNGRPIKVQVELDAQETGKFIILLYFSIKLFSLEVI